MNDNDDLLSLNAEHLEGRAKQALSVYAITAVGSCVMTQVYESPMTCLIGSAFAIVAGLNANRSIANIISARVQEKRLARLDSLSGRDGPTGM